MAKKTKPFLNAHVQQPVHYLLQQIRREAVLRCWCFSKRPKPGSFQIGAAMAGSKMMNGIRGHSNEIKYPVNCAARLSSAASGGAPSISSPDAMDELYEPRPNKRFFRVLTVIGYMFSISFGAILLSLYYLFLWDPYEKERSAAKEAHQDVRQQMATISSSNQTQSDSVLDPVTAATSSLVTTILASVTSNSTPSDLSLLKENGSSDSLHSVASLTVAASAATAAAATSSLIASAVSRPRALASRPATSFSSSGQRSTDTSNRKFHQVDGFDINTIPSSSSSSSTSLNKWKWQMDNPFNRYAKALRLKTENHIRNPSKFYSHDTTGLHETYSSTPYRHPSKNSVNEQ